MKKRKNIFSKKVVCLIFLIILLGAIFPTSVAVKTNDEELSRIEDVLDSLDEEDITKDVEKSGLYSKFQNIVGDNEEIKYCGPAYIESQGKGLFMLRNKHIIRLESYFLNSPFRVTILWYIFASYTDDNASTNITSLTTGEKNSVSGKHTFLTGVFVFPFYFQLSIIESLLELILQKDVNISFIEFIKKIQGGFPWDWTLFGLPIGWITIMLQFATTYSLLKCLIPIKGLFKPLSTHGYAPFVIWTEPSS